MPGAGHLPGETIANKDGKKNDLSQVPRSVPNSALKAARKSAVAFVQKQKKKRKMKLYFDCLSTCLDEVNYRMYRLSESYGNARVAVTKTRRGQPLQRKSEGDMPGT